MVRMRTIILSCLFILYFIICAAILQKGSSDSWSNTEFSVNSTLEPSRVPKALSDLLITFKPVIESNEHAERCIPPSTSFTQEELEFFYKYQTYPRCSLPTKDSINLSASGLEVRCENNAKPFYYFDNLPSQKMGGGRARIEWKDNKDGLEKSEFAFVNCNNSVHARVLNRFNPDVSRRANAVRSTLTSSPRNLNVLVLIFDSVSRFNAERYWPKTLKYLTDGISATFNSSYGVYNFKYGLPFNYHTKENTVPIVVGKFLADHYIDMRTYPQNSNKYKRMQEIQQNFIWKHYWRLGYVTMFLHDTVWDSQSNVFGKKIEADHTLLNFWRVAYAVYGYHDYMNGQRCAGDQNSHYFSLNYTLQFFENYSMNSKFAYLHLNAAHEQTGNVKTVDEDLALFMKSLLAKINPHTEDFVMFLMSDHGIAPPSLVFDIRGYIESRSPMAYVVSSKSLGDVTNASEALEHNKDVVFSRFDINLSLKHLAYFPYPGIKQSYNELKKDYPLKDVISLFHEKANTSRTCNDLGVKKHFCTCRGYESFDLSDKIDEAVTYRALELLKLTVINNSDTCEAIRSIHLLSSKKFEFDVLDGGLKRNYEFNGLLNDNTKVSLLLNFCTSSSAEEIEFMKTCENPDNILIIDGEKYCLKLRSIQLDPTCGNSYCLC